MKKQTLVITPPWKTMKATDNMPSLNDFYQSRHWYKRHKLAKAWHGLVKALCLEQKIEPVEEYKVDIHVITYWPPGERRIDPDQIAGPEKMIVDGLVKSGILENDSPIYINKVHLGPCVRAEDLYIECIIEEGTAPFKK